MPRCRRITRNQSINLSLQSNSPLCQAHNARIGHGRQGIKSCIKSNVIRIINTDRRINGNRWDSREAERRKNTIVQLVDDAAQPKGRGHANQREAVRRRGEEVGEVGELSRRTQIDQD